MYGASAAHMPLVRSCLRRQTGSPVSSCGVRAPESWQRVRMAPLSPLERGVEPFRKMCAVVQHPLAKGARWRAPVGSPRPMARCRALSPCPAPVKRIAVSSLAASGRCTTTREGAAVLPETPMAISSRAGEISLSPRTPSTKEPSSPLEPRPGGRLRLSLHGPPIDQPPRGLRAHPRFVAGPKKSLSGTCSGILGLTKMDWNNNTHYKSLPVTLVYSKAFADIVRQNPSMVDNGYDYRNFM